MKSMYQRSRRVLGFSTLAAVIAGVVLSAHSVTYQGTVLAVEAARVQVRTVDETKKEDTVWFVVNKDTRVKRGDATVTYANAKITKGERIVVIIDHDATIKMLATDIRLAATGRTIQLTGELKGHTITVSKIVAPKEGK